MFPYKLSCHDGIIQLSFTAGVSGSPWAPDWIQPMGFLMDHLQHYCLMEAAGLAEPAVVRPALTVAVVGLTVVSSHRTNRAVAA